MVITSVVLSVKSASTCKLRVLFASTLKTSNILLESIVKFVLVLLITVWFSPSMSINSLSCITKGVCTVPSSKVWLLFFIAAYQQKKKNCVYFTYNWKE